MLFDPDTLYRTDDPKLLVFGVYSTLAAWRSQGRGPAFIKIGGRVHYRGRDLNQWIDARRIPTADQPAPAAA